MSKGRIITIAGGCLDIMLILVIAVIIMSAHNTKYGTVPTKKVQHIDTTVDKDDSWNSAGVGSL